MGPAPPDPLAPRAARPRSWLLARPAGGGLGKPAGLARLNCSRLAGLRLGRSGLSRSRPGRSGLSRSRPGRSGPGRRRRRARLRAQRGLAARLLRLVRRARGARRDCQVHRRCPVRVPPGDLGWLRGAAAALARPRPALRPASGPSCWWDGLPAVRGAGRGERRGGHRRPGGPGGAGWQRAEPGPRRGDRPRGGQVLLGGRLMVRPRP